ncbi:MAG: CDP-diacylglycerol--serine O-phosphatidyltransferase [Thermoplasmata archaeon]|nr:CDP-diacylglycerol--serine O-phosphatidyltransferase [Thermoplasmata archaeon]
MHWLSKISSADLLTLTNGLLGMMAITYILDGKHVFAAMLIFMAVIVDGMDGMAARKFKKKHDFGRFLDSISDSVSFCLAPGILIYSNFYDKSLGNAWSSIPNAAGMIGTVMFVGFGLLRLARFAGKDYMVPGFRGLPTPAAALIAIVLCLLWGNPEFNPFSMSYELYPVITASIGLSILMVSDVPYPKVGGKPALAVGTILAVGILIMGLYVLEMNLELPYTEAFLILLILLTIYLVGGPIYEVTRPDYAKPEKRRRRRRRQSKK